MKRALVFVAALASACSSAGGTGNGTLDFSTGSGCTKDTDCKGTRVCIGGMCVQPTTEDMVVVPPPDLTLPTPDLGFVPDLSRVVDLAVVPDLTGANDATTTIDFTVAVDATSTVDASGANDGSVVVPPDLAVPPVDASVPIDLATPPDLKPLTAWGAACTATSTCAAPTGESAFCAGGLGSPVCLHTCNSEPDYALCEGGRGLCLPVGNGTKYCVVKCGDAENATCGAGAACAQIGFRGPNRVGACVPDCGAASGSADACMYAGTVCDPVHGNCTSPNCTNGCATGTTCQNGECNPTSPLPLYGACTTTTPVCSDNFCIANTYGGFCTHACDTSAAGLNTCGAAGVCWVDNAAPVNATPNDSGTDPYYGGGFVNLGGRQAGLCMKGCTVDADCPSTFGWHCADTYGGRACIPDNAVAAPTINAGSQQPGDPCTKGSDCVTGLCAIRANWAYGVCERANTTVQCPANTVASSSNALECLTSCSPSTGAECVASQECVPQLNGGGLCDVVVCRDSSDCTAATAKCDPNTGTCVAASSTSSGSAVGAACSTGGTCASGDCLTVDGSGKTWPSGYCTIGCTVLDDFTDTCTTGSVCSAAYIDVYGLCLDLCDAQGGGVTRFGGCRTGYQCAPFAGGDTRFGACVPL